MTRFVGAGRAAGRHLDRGTYMEVGYEDLLAEPERIMRAVCDFLGESFDLRVDGVVRLAPHPATLALVWAGMRRRVGLGRYLDESSAPTFRQVA